MNTNTTTTTTTKYSNVTKYLQDVPEPILDEVLRLGKVNAFDEALRLVHSAGFPGYSYYDVQRFYYSAAYPPPPPPPQPPAPEPENPIAVQLAHGVPPRRYSKI